MNQYLDASDKIGAIRLERNHPSGKGKVWILVEGINDVKLFDKLFNDKVSVEQVHGGVEQLKKAVKTLIKETDHVLGIRDADFLNLENKEQNINSLFMTDFHDAEMLMVSSDATIKAVCAEHMIKDNKTSYTGIRNNVINSILFLGCIRWFNYIHNLELNFKGIKFSSDNSHVLSNVNKRSSNKKREITKSDIEKLLPDEDATIEKLYNICNGHDFENAFAKLVNETHNNKNIKPEEIGKALRLSYNIEAFKNTKLYKSFVDWETKHSIPLIIKDIHQT